MQPVRCVDCGFLAVRHRQTDVLAEVKADARARWDFPPRSDPPGPPVVLPIEAVRAWRPAAMYDPLPVCAAGAFDLGAEAHGSDRPAAVLPVITADRTCPRFFAWRPCLSPEEHQRMWYGEQLQKAQAEQRKSDRRWQISLAVLAGLFGLVGVMVGRLWPSTPPQTIIQQPVEPKVVQPKPENDATK